MKLATKKFFHNVLAIAVSVCMVCTMTPSLAWATSGSGDGASETATSTTIGDGNGKATGESIVKGKVTNKNFKLAASADKNYESKAKFIEDITGSNPLKATMPDNGVPSNYTVSWLIREVEINKEYNPDQEGSADNPKLLYPNGEDSAIEISRNAYTKESTPKDSDGVPTFEYPSLNGMIVQPDDLSMDNEKRYEFIIKATDDGNGEEVHASTIITLLPDYPEQVIGAGDGSIITVSGDIYQKFTIPPAVSVVEVTPLDPSDPKYQKAVQEAASNNGETIKGVTQVALINDALPEGEDPYAGTVEVRLPVPADLGDVKEGDVVNVYIVDDKGNVLVQEGTIGWALDPNSDPVGKPLTDESGNKIPAIVVDVEGTGKILGSFAVGIPAEGSFYITTIASDGGQISPAGEDIATPLGTSTAFSAYAITSQYKFTGFTLKVNDVEKTIVSADLGYNNVTLTPSAYGIKDGDYVELKANFALAVPGQYTRTLTARLINENGASGSFTVSTVLVKGMKSASGRDIVLRGTALDKRPVTPLSYISNTAVDRDAGLLLEFLPNEGSYVKAVMVNGKPASFQGTSLLLGTVDENLTIQVIYAPGTQPAVITNNVQVTIQKRPSGSYPATLSNAEGYTTFDVSYPVSAGGQLTIKASPYKDIFKLEHVYVYSPATSTEKTDIVDRVYVSPNNSTYNYPQDEIQLFNVAADTRIELAYKVLPAYITGEQVEGGTWGWIPGGGAIVVPDPEINPTSTAPAKARARAAAPSASTYASLARLLEQVQNGSLRLESDGDWARLVIRAKEGYQIGDVSINGVRINRLLTKRTGDTGDFYTVIVYLGTAGSAPEGIGDVLGDPAGPDKIFYTNSNNTQVQMTFNADVIKMPSYNLITTSVTEFGGGTITPTRNVEYNGTAVIDFFPDLGYKVDRVWLDGDELYDGKEGDFALFDTSLEIYNVQSDHAVRVAFTPGEQPGGIQTRYTITATAGVGGSITPYGNFPVYEGSTQELVIIPNTGYEISRVYVDGEEKTAEDGIFETRNTIKLENIRKDTTVSATFAPLGSSNAATYTLTPTKEGNGRIVPNTATTVGAGATATFTVIPDDGWFVQDVRAIYGTGSNTTEVSLLSLYNRTNFTFELMDVRQNATIKAVFEKGGDNGKYPGSDQDLPKPPGPDQLIGLGDLTYNPDKQPSGENPGAVLTPSLSDLVVVKEPGTNHAATDQTFTVTVMDGYEIDTPVAEKGIVVKDGAGNPLSAVMGDSSDTHNAVRITQVADGVFTVTVPKEMVTEGLSIELNTHPKTASTENTTLHKVTLGVAGDGYITPGMTGVGAQPQTIEVASGKTQSFNFFPADGWKLYTVYLNGTPTTVTDNFLTIPNIQQDTTVEAVFSKLAENETPPAKPKTFTIDIEMGPNSNGLSVSPLASKVTVVEHSSLTISATPKDGWKVTATDNGSTARVINNAVELGDITANHKIVIDQEQIVTMKYYRLNVTSNGPGTTSPSGTTLVVEKQPQTITLIPNSGMKVRSVSVDGNDRTNNVTWSTMSLALASITKDTDVVVEFCTPDELDPSDPGYGKPQPDSVTYYDVITMAPDGGGMVSPASSKVAAGGSVNLTIMPNSGYELESILVGNEDRTRFVDKASNTLSVTGVNSDLSVRAKFKKSNAYELEDFYTLFVNAEGDAEGGGTVSPMGAITVAGGGSQVLTIIPDPGYKVSYIEASHNGTVISRVDNFTGSSYTFFNVTQDMNIRVKFVKGSGGASVLTHDIVATSTVSGRVSPEGTIKAANGSNASFTFVPNPGFKLSYVNIDGRSIPGQYILNNQYIFSDVREAHTLHAVFVEEDSDASDYATISIGKTVHGLITPSENIIVPKGTNRDIVITPFYGYKVKDVLVGIGDNATPASIDRDGKHVEYGDSISTADYDYSNGRLTLKDINSNIRISAEFARDIVVVPDDANAPNYIPVSASTTGKDGAGGETILGSGGYVISPDFQHEPDPSELHPQITIAPNPGCTIEEVTLTYGDGSKVVTDENGVYVYDKNGNLLNGDFTYNADGTLNINNGKPINSSGQVASLDENGNPIDPIKYPSRGPGAAGYPTSTDTTARTIYEQGYVVMDGIKAVVTNGITCDVIFRPLTDNEKKEIEEGSLTPAQYVEFNITSSGGGRVFPEGRQKVAQGQGVVVQFMPSNGYEVSSVLIDGVNKIDEVMSNRTRNYIFQPADTYANHTVEVTFSFVGNVIEYYDVKATSNVSGGVSPEYVSAPKGSDPVVYFFPPEGKKVAEVTVKKNGAVVPNAYVDGSYMYVANNINGNMEIDVRYEDAAEGENTWSVVPVEVTADCPNGNGKVSPTRATVPAGSPQTFFFEPEQGYMVDYVMFNNIATTLRDNPTSYAVTPSAGAENKLLVYFREATARDKKYVNLTPEVAEGSNATIEPKTVRAELGGSATFYVSPGNRQTIDTITVDGWPVTFRPALPEGVNPDPNSDYSTYIVTIDDVQEGSKVVVTTKSTSKNIITVQKHTMTIRGENVLYSPMGTVTVPEGGNQVISVNPLSGYYLDSVIVTDKDASGNVVNTIDMTESVRANRLSVPMGAYNREVYIKYLAVGDTSQATPAYITIGNTKMEDGRDVNATISMFRDAQGNLVPITVDPDTRMLMGTYEVGGEPQPMAFVRGSSYTFYATADPLDDKKIILSEATYNGNEQTVPNLTGMIANMKINASGILDLVFRELKEGEAPVITQDFTVKFRVVGDKGGSIRPTQAEDPGMTVQMGNSTGRIMLLPNDNHWMIKSVTEYLYSDTDWDNEDSRMGAPIVVDPSKYKDESYDCRVGAPANILVEVEFVECATVNLSWDEELGLLAPNAGKDKPLKLEASEVVSEEDGSAIPYPFIIAPFEDCYVANFEVAKESNEPENFVNYNNELEQTQAAYDFLISSGYDVKRFDLGGGQVTPENMPEDDSNGDKPSTMSLMSVGARANSEWYGFKPIDNSVTVPDTSTTLQRPYSVLTELSPNESYVNLDLRRLNDNQQFTITPRVNGTGGRIEPATAQTVDQGGSQTFNFIADQGYTVKRVLVDGSPITGGQLGSNGTSYTFFNVDRNHTIEVEFGPLTSNESSRLLRVASSLARTGDLTGPAVGALLVVAALGLAVTAVSYIRRQQRRRRRTQAMR